MCHHNQDEIQLFTKSKLLLQLDNILNISYLQTIIPNCQISKIPLCIINRFNNYKKAITSLEDTIVIHDFEQIFRFQIFWDNDFEVFTDFIFNINRLDELVKRGALNSITKLLVSELYDKIDCSGFEHQPPSRTSGAIYLSYFFPQNNKLFILDGNHRIYEAYNKNEKTIDALILSEIDYFYLLENDSLRILYKIYRDYVIYLNVIKNEIDIDSSFFIGLLDSVIAYNKL